MKTVGLIGGMSWESTVLYYRILNEQIRSRMGGLHSAQCVIFSFDFHEIEALQSKGDWDTASLRMIDAAKVLEDAGADFLVLCTNTMHKLADSIQTHSRIPLLHIADATAQKILLSGHKRVGLLGTKYTMEEDFYKGRLESKFGLDVLIPNQADRQLIHDVIYNELCLGIIKEDSRNSFERIMFELKRQGAEAVILGCTEIGLLINQDYAAFTLFDTTMIHVKAAVEWALDTQL